MPNVFDFLENCRNKKHAEQTGLEPKKNTFIHNYIFGRNDIRTIIYISAEICPDNLDKGFDLTAEARQVSKVYGVHGYQPAQYIGKQLGGVGDPCNVFPWNPKLDMSAWKADEDQVYTFLKQGDNRYALLLYSIEINRYFRDELSRPYRIYYSFQLFENGQVVGQAIEGSVTNTSPKLTNDDYYSDSFGRKSAFRGVFKFEPQWQQSTAQ